MPPVFLHSQPSNQALPASWSSTIGTRNRSRSYACVLYAYVFGCVRPSLIILTRQPYGSASQPLPIGRPLVWFSSWRNVSVPTSLPFSQHDGRNGATLDSTVRPCAYSSLMSAVALISFAALAVCAEVSFVNGCLTPSILSIREPPAPERTTLPRCAIA